MDPNVLCSVHCERVNMDPNVLCSVHCEKVNMDPNAQITEDLTALSRHEERSVPLGKPSVAGVLKWCQGPLQQILLFKKRFQTVLTYKLASVAPLQLWQCRGDRSIRTCF